MSPLGRAWSSTRLSFNDTMSFAERQYIDAAAQSYFEKKNLPQFLEVNIVSDEVVLSISNVGPRHWPKLRPTRRPGQELKRVLDQTSKCSQL